ncbi:MAG: hypothetical protein ABJQ29_09050 [Luteolibacter sp.]
MNPRYFLLTVLLLPFTAFAGVRVTVEPAAGGPGEFAASEIMEAAGPGIDANISITVRPDAKARAQAYSIQVADGKITVTGVDATGAMYGGLDIAEAIRTGHLAELKDSEHQPHILQRGIKFNLPLDLRTPTYSEPGDAAQQNIPVIWELDFWREFLDQMAEHRYNVLSLWSLHPFPSIVKVPEFPDVALNDVWRTNESFTRGFGGLGENYVRPEMLANHGVVKEISIDEKILFWQEVMQLAKDRGVDIYFFTWNAFFYGAEGKDGITGKKASPRNIEYFRASVRETIKTYPLLAGFGITAGESMKEKDMGGMNKEEWLWRTYGEGIRDGLEDTPDRKFRLIHRFHMTGLSDITNAFAELPCPLDLSFKYAVAHMYSVPDPEMIQPALPFFNPQLRSWLTLRNDDVYSFRWADPEFARAFIKAIPPEDKIAGFYMGPDGYVWGRDFLTKDPGEKRQTVMGKQWLSFDLWGRLAYEPDLPDSTFERQVAARFPGTDATLLCSAWAGASKTFPHITRFFWGDFDFRWFPEACRAKSGFHTVKDFIEGGTMPGADVLNIIEWRNGMSAGKMPTGTTPMQIADTLYSDSSKALESLEKLKTAEIQESAAREYAATLNDIEAMSRLGLYYAAKIRGACELAIYDKTGEPDAKANAVTQLETALGEWKKYSEAYTRQYVQPVLYNRSGIVDIPAQTKDVEKDLASARNWIPGTIEEKKIQRAPTEKGFKK